MYKILNSQLKPDIKGVLIDMDGVILDTEKLYVRFWQEAAHNLGINMTEKEALGLRSSNRIDATNYLHKLYGNKADYDEIRNLRIKLMNEYIQKNGVEAKPYALELLKYLNKHNIPCALATSSPYDRIKAYLIPLGFYDKFNKICSCHEVSRGKPYPDIYLFAAKALGLDPKNCLALEDSPSGILSSFRAETIPVIIPDQDIPDSNTLSLSYALADSLDDVISLIEAIKK